MLLEGKLHLLHCLFKISSVELGLLWSCMTLKEMAGLWVYMIISRVIITSVASSNVYKWRWVLLLQISCGWWCRIMSIVVLFLSVIIGKHYSSQNLLQRNDFSLSFFARDHHHANCIPPFYSLHQNRRLQDIQQTTNNRHKVSDCYLISTSRTNQIDYKVELEIFQFVFPSQKNRCNFVKHSECNVDEK
jgi:hypothetical protein